MVTGCIIFQKKLNRKENIILLTSPNLGRAYIPLVIYSPLIISSNVQKTKKKHKKQANFYH